jgi:hypothetical protein
LHYIMRPLWMITVCPNGGLGNQLFQFAAGRALAIHNQTPLEIDTWHYGSRFEEGPRPLVLHKLGLAAQFKFYTERGLNDASSLWQKAGRKFQVVLRPVVRDNEAYAESDFFSSKPNSMLVGYFQSLIYSQKYLNIVLTEINLNKAVSPRAIDQAKNISDCSVCAIQVRRGDYVNNPLFDVIDFPSYYAKAIKFVRQNFINLEFLVFSDDPGWCAQQHIFKGMQIHQSAEPENVADAMFLMTKCRAHIIANSSYGWWGATLASRGQEDIVVAPKTWFRGIDTTVCQLSFKHWTLL